MKHAVIYVPGLGDHRSRSQQRVLRAWQAYGIKTAVVCMQWRTDEPFAAKLKRLLTAIDDFRARGYRVSLIGVSAGASAVINAYAARPSEVQRVVCICGKLRNPETIHPVTFRRNPAFLESLERLPKSIEVLTAAQRERILSIRPLADESVPPQDTFVPGAKVKTIPTVGHVVSIATAITAYSFSIVRFVRKA